MVACDDPVMCVAVVADPDDPDTILIREDEYPDVVVKTSRANWEAFVDGIKAGHFDEV